MKSIRRISLLALLALLYSACSDGSNEPDAEHAEAEKPVQHLKIENITTSEEAASVFKKSIADIQEKKELTPAQLHEIHMTTYSLEKAVAYYVETTKGARKQLAEKIAVVVEEIHLASENNRTEETKESIQQLSSLVEGFTLNE